MDRPRNRSHSASDASAPSVVHLKAQVASRRATIERLVAEEAQAQIQVATATLQMETTRVRLVTSKAIREQISGMCTKLKSAVERMSDWLIRVRAADTAETAANVIPVR